MISKDNQRTSSFLIGCFGWNYPDTPDKGVGWTEVFYPDKETKRLRHYSQFFETAEMDPTFYNRFYSKMTKGTFIGMTKATPEKFQFSVKHEISIYFSALIVALLCRAVLTNASLVNANIVLIIREDLK
ncbi:MAG: DUF72 domain-containing protein, partial [Nitrososphaeraceae archaeon]